MLTQYNSTIAIFLIVMALLGIGLVMVYSSSGASAPDRTQQELLADCETFAGYHSMSYLKRQLMWAAVGLALLFAFYFSDYQLVKRYSLVVLIGAGLLLLLVLIPHIGVKVNGAKRWVRFGFIQFQPSEFAKLALVVFMAKFLSDHQKDITRFRRVFLPAAGVMLLFSGLILIEPDFGMAVVIGLIVIVLWFVAGVRIHHIASLLIVGLPVLLVALIAVPWRIKRLLAFLNPEKYYYDTGYQLCQSLYSVGSGGLFGKGLGKGFQKYQFVSELPTDFIYAIICEELGLIGATVIVILFLGLMYLGVRIAMRAPDHFGAYLSVGIVSMIGVSAIVHFFVVVGLVPTKGLTLPFISYGGSSLIVNMSAIGILLSVSKFREIVVYGSRSRKRR